MHTTMPTGQLFFIRIVLFLFQASYWEAMLTKEKNLFLIITAFTSIVGFLVCIYLIIKLN